MSKVERRFFLVPDQTLYLAALYVFHPWWDPVANRPKGDPRERANQGRAGSTRPRGLVPSRSLAREGLTGYFLRGRHEREWLKDSEQYKRSSRAMFGGEWEPGASRCSGWSWCTLRRPAAGLHSVSRWGHLQERGRRGCTAWLCVPRTSETREVEGERPRG